MMSFFVLLPVNEPANGSTATTSTAQPLIADDGLHYKDHDIVNLVLGYFIALVVPVSNALMTIVTRQAVFHGEDRALLFMLWDGFALLSIVAIGKGIA